MRKWNRKGDMASFKTDGEVLEGLVSYSSRMYYPIKSLIGRLDDTYFTSPERNRLKVRALINVLSAAQDAIKTLEPGRNVATFAAFEILRKDRSDSDAMRIGFVSKEIRAAVLLMRKPDLASEVADRFIFFRTLPTLMNGECVDAERDFRKAFAGMVADATRLRPAAKLQKSANNIAGAKC